MFLFLSHSDACIWSLSKKERMQIHKKATDHEKQFLYLPLHVFRKTTNLAKLLAPEPPGPDVNTSDIDSICNYSHKQLYRVGHWHEELRKLEFVGIDEHDNDIISEKSDSSAKSSTSKVSKDTRAAAQAEELIRTPRGGMRKRKVRFKSN